MIHQNHTVYSLNDFDLCHFLLEPSYETHCSVLPDLDNTQVVECLAKSSWMREHLFLSSTFTVWQPMKALLVHLCCYRTDWVFTCLLLILTEITLIFLYRFELQWTSNQRCWLLIKARWAHFSDSCLLLIHTSFVWRFCDPCCFKLWTCHWWPSVLGVRTQEKLSSVSLHFLFTVCLWLFHKNIK